MGWIPNAHTLDPHYSVDFAERHVLYAIYNTLVATNRTFDIVPELARAWSVSPGGKSVTFGSREPVDVAIGDIGQGGAILPYAGRHFGGRFSRNAFIPSWPSGARAFSTMTRDAIS